MTPSELKYQIESRNPNSHFFSRANMRFAGDRMSNYGVRTATIQCHDYDEAGNWKSGATVTVEAWELYRKRPVKAGLQSSAYFNRETFAQCWPIKE